MERGEKKRKGEKVQTVRERESGKETWERKMK